MNLKIGFLCGFLSLACTILFSVLYFNGVINIGAGTLLHGYMNPKYLLDTDSDLIHQAQVLNDMSVWSFKTLYVPLLDLCSFAWVGGIPTWLYILAIKFNLMPEPDNWIFSKAAD